MSGNRMPQRWEDYSRGQLIWWLTTFAAVGLSWWSYRGPFRWIAETQLALFGSYSQKIAFLLSILLTGLPGQLSLANVGVRAAHEQPTEAWRPSRLWFLVVPLVPLMIAVYLSHQAGRLRLESTSAARLEWGAKAPSRWLAVDATTLPDATLCLKFNECYVPLVSAEWKRVVPVAAFLKARCKSDDVPTDGSFKGIVSYLGMPGHIRAAFERSPLKLRSDFIVLDWEEGPDDVRSDSRFFALFAAIVAVVISILLTMDYRRARVLERVLTRSRAAERARQLDVMRGQVERNTSVPMEPR